MQITTVYQENTDDGKLSIIALTVVGCIKNNSGTVLTAQPKAQLCGVSTPFQPCTQQTNKYCYSTRANN